MKSVPATEAKARFSSLLGDVQRGETVHITRHGKTIATLGPAGNVESGDVRAAINRMHKLRRAISSGETLEDLLAFRHSEHRY
ncbi:type II toxin-antitoxin system Phd/YefM family antitoxin [Nitratireductor sp. CH_MIT9313-5]|uniref:type II toxin-antitoxin system Phd/YefM family antitoxin n=1 Tax=Nitratireductor sp. CH_MIT9313-5 TaxID=3107764 RepID=UPI0030080624